MPEVNVILATAGHVDHGKSSLVKALTHTDPDRLPEEKRRGLTIDLGFAHLRIPDPRDGTRQYHIGIVDVPGHEDFVKNMVAGVGSIHIALLIVAADDGWMPQTEEHLQILIYLGVQRAVVALTKSDLIETNCEEPVHLVKSRLKASPFKDAPIVKTSAATGEGLKSLTTAIATVLSGMDPQLDRHRPRLPIDRVFSLSGIGTVITGTLSGGSLKKGQRISVQPHGVVSRIRSIQTHNRERECAQPGTRTALNLAHVSTGSRPAPQRVARGDVVTEVDWVAPSSTLDVMLERSSRTADTDGHSRADLKDGSRLRLHHGTTNVPACIVLMDAKSLEPGATEIAQLRCESPLCVLDGDRFILRDWPERRTLAGGIILDSRAERRRFRNVSRRAFLGSRAACPTDIKQWIRTQLTRDKVVPNRGLARYTAFSKSEIEAARAQLIQNGFLRDLGKMVVHSDWWEDLRERAAAAIDVEHKRHPDRPGITKSKLRQILGSFISGKDVFPLLLREMQSLGISTSGIFLRRASHLASLPAELHSAEARIRSLLNGRPWEPPSKQEIAVDSASRQALQFLLQSGDLVEISDKVVLSSGALDQAEASIRNCLNKNGSATVSEIRRLLRTSRRIAVPLLEFFDRKGVTLRQGDRRTLR